MKKCYEEKDYDEDIMGEVVEYGKKRGKERMTKAANKRKKEQNCKST